MESETISTAKRRADECTFLVNPWVLLLRNGDTGISQSGHEPSNQRIFFCVWVESKINENVCSREQKKISWKFYVGMFKKKNSKWNRRHASLFIRCFSLLHNVLVQKRKMKGKPPFVFHYDGLYTPLFKKKNDKSLFLETTTTTVSLFSNKCDRRKLRVKIGLVNLAAVQIDLQFYIAPASSQLCRKKFLSLREGRETH